MKMHRIIALIGILLILPVLCLPAFATGNDGTLYLRCETKHDGVQIVFTGDEYALVKIAEAQVENINGTDTIRYVTLPDFQPYACDWGALNANQLRENAKALASVAAQHGKYAGIATVDEQGSASFENIAPALYLVLRTKVTESHKQYSVDPFLVSIPMKWEGDILSNVIASPKYGWTPPEERLPQTGQLKWPVPVLTGLGVAFILIGLRMYKKK